MSRKEFFVFSNFFSFQLFGVFSLWIISHTKNYCMPTRTHHTLDISCALLFSFSLSVFTTNKYNSLIYSFIFFSGLFAIQFWCCRLRMTGYTLFTYHIHTWNQFSHWRSLNVLQTFSRFSNESIKKTRKHRYKEFSCFGSLFLVFFLQVVRVHSFLYGITPPKYHQM